MPLSPVLRLVRMASVVIVIAAIATAAASLVSEGRFDPTRFFDRPRAVLDDPRLDAAQKRRILESWALDAQRLSESEAENMPGRATERPFLREAKLALLELDH